MIMVSTMMNGSHIGLATVATYLFQQVLWQPGGLSISTWAVQRMDRARETPIIMVGRQAGRHTAGCVSRWDHNAVQEDTHLHTPIHPVYSKHQLYHLSYSDPEKRER
jgi:hypothetical protein